MINSPIAFKFDTGVKYHVFDSVFDCGVYLIMYLLVYLMGVYCIFFYINGH